MAEKKRTLPSAIISKLHRWIKDELATLEQRDPKQLMPYLNPKSIENDELRSVTAEASELLDQVEVDFVFRDEEGFLGFFKSYDKTETWPQELLEDLHGLTLLRQEQVLDWLINPKTPSGGADAVRPWTHHLFAVVPGPLARFGSVWNDLRASHLMEEVGLSLLVCSEEVGQANPINSCADVRRFLAPLLLTARKWRYGSGIGDWRKNLVGKLNTLLRPGETKGELVEWATDLMQEEIGKVLLEEPSVGRLELTELSGVRLRRFQTETGTLPFGRLVLVHGLNGTGKSALLEAIELALTGKLFRFEQRAKDQGELPGALYSTALAANGKPPDGLLLFSSTLSEYVADRWRHHREEKRLNWLLACLRNGPQ